MCVDCKIKAMFDRLCQIAADTYVEEVVEAQGAEPDIFAALARVGQFISLRGINELKLTLDQRQRIIVDFEHTIMEHVGLVWDCPPCREKFGKKTVDDHGH